MIGAHSRADLAHDPGPIVVVVLRTDPRFQSVSMGSLKGFASRNRNIGIHPIEIECILRGVPGSVERISVVVITTGVVSGLSHGGLCQPEGHRTFSAIRRDFVESTLVDSPFTARIRIASFTTLPPIRTACCHGKGFGKTVGDQEGARIFSIGEDVAEPCCTEAHSVATIPSLEHEFIHRVRIKNDGI